MKWYVLFVETGKETVIQRFIVKYLNEFICNSIFPKRKLVEKKHGIKHEIIRPLFPGYIFINANMCVDYYYKIKSIPSVFKILGNGAAYSEVEYKEISIILKLVGNSDIIDYSQIFIENSKVFVKSGPLQGMEGLIKSIDKRHSRARIIIQVAGTPKVIDLGIELLNIPAT